MRPARSLLSQVDGSVPPYKYATGPDVLTYGDLLQVTARLSRGRAPLILSVPVLTPRLSSYWVGLVTDVDWRVPPAYRRLLFGSNIEVVLAVLAFVPFLLDQPVLLVAVVGHVLAVLVVTALSVTLLSVRQNKPLAVDA
jgi:hypothetical protein